MASGIVLALILLASLVEFATVKIFCVCEREICYPRVLYLLVNSLDLVMPPLSST